MDHVVIVKTAQDMQDGIGLPDICQELVAQSFPFAGPFDESGDIHDIHGSRDNALGIDQFFQFLQSLIRHVHNTNIGFYCAKRKISALGFSIGQTIE
jgi:hypothetical protein